MYNAYCLYHMVCQSWFELSSHFRLAETDKKEQALIWQGWHRQKQKDSNFPALGEDQLFTDKYPPNFFREQTQEESGVLQFDQSWRD